MLFIRTLVEDLAHGLLYPALVDHDAAALCEIDINHRLNDATPRPRNTLGSTQATFGVLAPIDEFRVVQREPNNTMDDMVDGLDAEHKAVWKKQVSNRGAEVPPSRNDENEHRWLTSFDHCGVTACHIMSDKINAMEFAASKSMSIRPQQVELPKRPPLLDKMPPKYAAPKMISELISMIDMKSISSD